MWHLFQYQGLGGLSGFPNCLGWKFWGLFDEEIKSQSEFYAGMLSLSWLVQQMWGCAPQTNRQKTCILCTVHINKTQLCKKRMVGHCNMLSNKLFFYELGFRRPVGSLGDDQSGWWKRLAACHQCSKEFCQVAGSPTIWTRNILLEKPKHMLPDTFTFVKMQPMLCLQPRKNLDGKFHADIFT